MGDKALLELSQMCMGLGEGLGKGAPDGCRRLRAGSPGSGSRPCCPVGRRLWWQIAGGGGGSPGGRGRMRWARYVKIGASWGG